MDKNPCDECIIKMCCEKICDPAIKYYSSRVRYRSREETIKATGYMWEFEDGELVSLYEMSPKSKEIYYKPGEKLVEKVPVEKEISILDKFINFIKKGLNKCLKIKS